MDPAANPTNAAMGSATIPVLIAAERTWAAVPMGTSVAMTFPIAVR
jgi:hypothetical protein